MEKGAISTETIRRSFWLGVIMFGVFAVLMFRILAIQVFDFDKYQSKVINQMTTESPVPADRGKIYDRNGNVLATNVTTYRVFISPSGILSAQEEIGENSKTQYAEIVSYGLAQTLGVNYEDVYKQAKEYTKYLDRTIMRKVDEETADRVRQFIKDYELETMVYLEAQSTRYYPGGTLGAHMIGFTSSDGVGLYGLEYQYDEYLKGIDGYYITARDSHGNEMPYEYSSYIDAVSGYNLTTTIDTTIQNFLEEQLEATVVDHDVKNRACGIVMNVKTGAILAMATSSPFDLNDPWTLDARSQEALAKSGYAENSEIYNTLSREMLLNMWSNKAIAESYIPGSTFKILTSAMALEEQVVTLNETLTCSGRMQPVRGVTVKCHKVEGHGPLTYAEGLQNSCNVWFMTLGARVGIKNFQNYAKALGYYEKTGIDLPGEATSIFASEMSALDLAIYAFGQNFNVTPIQQVTAVAAIANGGTLVTPYVVESISDNSGNTIYRHETDVKRQVISESVCDTLAQVLEEGVSGNGGAKNAYVAGYRVAAKTGTSEKKTQGDEGMYICSTVAFAPADDPEIVMIIIVDEPTKGVLYGSTVAAPYVAKALENILPYYGVEPIYSEKELANTGIRTPNYKGMTVSGATERAESAGINVVVVGSGDKVTSQSPASGTTIDKTYGVVVLYTGGASAESDLVTVPDLTGKTSVAANHWLVNLRLNVKIEGVNNPYVSASNVPVVVKQSIEPGTQVKAGTVVTVEFRYMDKDEESDYLG